VKIDGILMGLGLKYLSNKMDGKKTYFGAAILMLMGIGKFLTGAIMGIVYMWPELAPPDITGPVSLDDILTLFEVGSGFFASGIGLLGLGHKFEKASM
jgi:hypothetical protein